LKHYFRIDAVTVYFAISMRTVYRLLDDGDLQATRIRGCVRVSAEEIKRFEERLADADQY
jgi:excisionase family DNA binding protein